MNKADFVLSRFGRPKPLRPEVTIMNHWDKDKPENALKNHIATHGGKVDPNCRACAEIQERYK